MPGRAFFKRYRMECDLRQIGDLPILPEGFFWQSWSPHLLECHADVKYRSFRGEMDVEIFPSLGSLTGCLELMRNITSRKEFIPEATWLIVGPDGPCATIQGLREERFGAIQNVGVAPDLRGRGLGSCLVLQALHGFRRCGLHWATLEVTAHNIPALRLYERLGFQAVRILYKPTHTIPEEVAVHEST